MRMRLIRARMSELIIASFFWLHFQVCSRMDN